MITNYALMRLLFQHNTMIFDEEATMLAKKSKDIIEF
jgi:hypothetical protein